MTLKPPTKSFPKLVIKEWPEPLYQTREKISDTEREFGRNWDTPNARKSLSSFTRVGEDVQKENSTQKAETET